MGERSAVAGLCTSPSPLATLAGCALALLVSQDSRAARVACKKCHIMHATTRCCCGPWSPCGTVLAKTPARQTLVLAAGPCPERRKSGALQALQVGNSIYSFPSCLRSERRRRLRRASTWEPCMGELALGACDGPTRDDVMYTFQFPRCGLLQCKATLRMCVDG